jgi:catechol 2,3-dioxygenase-like lactoylglutathione lyase family enzyme
MTDTPMQLGQVAISVSDLERSIAFYRDRVGLAFMFQAPNVAFFDCGGVRLMLGLDTDPARKPFGTVLYFRVDDIQRSFDRLKANGVSTIREPHLIARMADFDLWMAFLRDPDENMFGIMAEIRDRNG